MSRWILIPAALIVVSTSTIANADWRLGAGNRVSWQTRTARPMLTSAGGQTVIIENGAMYGGKVMHGGKGYGGSCCEPRSACCGDIWAGFRASSHCWHHRLKGWARGCRSKCGSACGLGCGAGHGKGCSSGCGGVKGGGKVVQHGKAAACGSCNTGCGHRRFGLFSWLHASNGCGCGSSYGHGKGHSTYVLPSTEYHVPAHEGGNYLEDPPQPIAPPIPEPVSTQSATRWWAPSRLLPIR